MNLDHTWHTFYFFDFVFLSKGNTHDGHLSHTLFTVHGGGV